MTRHLVVMVKAPRAGRVKTRLGRGIGMVDAAWWFRHQTAQLLRRLDGPRWRLGLAVSPDTAIGNAGAWPAHLPRWGQGQGDLGARMARIFRQMPPGPVAIIGADIPAVTGRHIEAAFTALGAADAVFGPAEDGGFWLVGLARRRAVPPELFQNVRWSGPHALSDSIATLPGHRIARIATLRDVDCADDLRAAGAQPGNLCLP